LKRARDIKKKGRGLCSFVIVWKPVPEKHPSGKKRGIKNAGEESGQEACKEGGKRVERLRGEDADPRSRNLGLSPAGKVEVGTRKKRTNKSLLTVEKGGLGEVIREGSLHSVRRRKVALAEIRRRNTIARTSERVNGEGRALDNGGIPRGGGELEKRFRSTSPRGPTKPPILNLGKEKAQAAGKSLNAKTVCAC